MSEQENIQLVRKLFDNLNSHNVDASDPYTHNSFQGTFSGVPGGINRDQNKEILKSYIDAFPNLHFDIRDIIAQGDKVAVTWVATGTNSGVMRMPTGGTMPATNKPARTVGTTVVEIRDSKVFRQEVYFNQVELLTQLGVMPALQVGR